MGTIGSHFYHFQGLKHNDANTLLLKTASKLASWDSVTQKLAASITEALGFLPLALLYAGEGIMNQLYRLDQYLNSHKVEKQKVREALDFRKGDSLYVNVYSSFEINFRGLQGKGNIKTDRAIQLLQMFTFSHRENILKDFLTNAAANPEVERREQEREKTRRVANQASQVRLSWSNMIKHIMLKVVLFFYKDRTPPVLPGFIRDSVASNDEEYRLNEALNELTQLSHKL